MTDHVQKIAHDVRMHVFAESAATGSVPQPLEISRVLGLAEDDVRAALRYLAANKVLILAPNDGDIWAANPFCAVPSAFRVDAGGKRYRAICIWDAMGIAAALDEDAVITASCGDCGESMVNEIRGRKLLRAEGIVHFAVPAKRWWDNIGFT